MSKLISIMLVTFIFIAPYHLAVASFNGSSPLLCVVTKALECSVENGCNEGTVERMNIPQFIRIDFKNYKISTPEGSEEYRESAIRNFEQHNGRLILQGIENSRGWSIVIAEDTGKMTGTASEGEGGFVVFGACTLD